MTLATHPSRRRSAQSPAVEAAGSGLLAIFQNLRPRLLRFLCARTGDAAEAEDVMQELWPKLAVLDTGPIASPEAYLHKMAANLVLDRARARASAQARASVRRRHQ